MGCGASTNGPASDEQQQEMFRFAVKEMWILCAGHFLSQTQTMKVEFPAKQKTELLEAAEKAAEDATGEAEEAGAKKEGGMFSQLKDAVVAKGQEVLAKGQEVAAKAKESLKEAKEAPIKDVQVDLLEASNPALLEKFATAIREREIADARGLVRGEEPYGQEEYKNCPSNKVSEDLYNSHREDFKSILMSHCALDKNSVVAAWGSIFGQIEKANAALGGKLNTKSLDVKDHIVDKTLKQMVQKMAEYEKGARERPGDKGVKDHKETFALCFSGAQLTEADYKKFRQGK
mmetsp:Transcript_20699/g.58051  ORF Transcript_20699/g.58051 Transcript_20699/m.58051 type:complete len:289 (-) Transcript_20699:54-920(-)